MDNVTVEKRSRILCESCDKVLNPFKQQIGNCSCNHNNTNFKLLNNYTTLFIYFKN